MLLPIIYIACMVPIQEAPGATVNGSGVLINPSLVLTAAHVIHLPIVGIRCGSVDIPAALVAENETEDLALLELAQPCTLTPSPLSKANPAPGTTVRAEGCPSGKCGWVLRGSVVGYDALPIPSKLPRTVLVADVPIWFGSSGGPLFNEKGHLVGIASQLIQLPTPDPKIFRLFAAFAPAESIIKFLEAATK